MKLNIRLLIILPMILLLCQGCLLERLIEVKNQFCRFDENFTIHNSEKDGLSVTSRTPVLHDFDIIKLLGADPSDIKLLADGSVVYKYILVKEDPVTHRYFSLSTTFEFVEIQDEFKLKTLSFEKNMVDVFSKKLICDVIKSLCSSERSILKRTATISLEHIDITMIPGLSDIETILGVYDVKETLSDSYERYTYYFKLESDDNEKRDSSKNAVVEIFHNKNTDRIYRARMKYLRYEINVEFTTRTVVVKVFLKPLEVLRGSK